MQQINNFLGGMVCDIDYLSIPKDSYLYAENFRINNVDENSGIAIELALGNTKVLDCYQSIPPYNNTNSIRILGMVSDNVDSIYLFCTCTYNNAPVCFIVKYKEYLHTSYPFITPSPVNTTPAIIYTDYGKTNKLGFNTSYKIKAVYNKESSSVENIYFVDGLNALRAINVVDSNLNNSDPTEFDVLPSFNNSLSIIVSKMQGGTLKSGRYQYAARFKISGRYTKYTHQSPIYSLSENTYSGTLSPETTNYGLSLTIPIESKYDFMELVRIYYGSNSVDSATIEKIYETPLAYTSNISINVLDFGRTAINEVTEDEYFNQSLTSYTASEIESKNNILFLGNVSDNEFNISGYDTRAYRFYYTAYDKLSGVEVASCRLNSIISDPISGTDANRIRLVRTTTSAPNWDSVPETHNCINMFNYSIAGVTTDIDHYNMIFQSNGTTIGGEGKNVSYVVADQSSSLSNTIPSSYNSTTNQMNYSTYSLSTITNSNKIFKGSGTEPQGVKQVGDYTTPTDYININYTNLFRSGETYRFGVIFGNSKGQETAVSWIGDIKFPLYNSGGITYKGMTQSTISISGDTVVTGDIVSYPLGVYFKFSNLSILQAQGVQYLKIVRCERTSDDKTIVDQGIMATMIKPSKGTEYVFNNYDCTIDNYVQSRTGNRMYLKPNMYTLLSPNISYNKITESDLENTYIQIIRRSNKAITYINNEISGQYTVNKINYTLDTINPLLRLGYQTATAYTLPKYFFYYVDVYDFSYPSISTNKTDQVYGAAKLDNALLMSNTTDYNSATEYRFPGDVTYKYYNRSYYNSAPFGTERYIHANSCKRMLVSTTLDTSSYDIRYYIYNISKINYGMYGGYTYNDRIRNTYVPASHPVLISSLVSTPTLYPICFGDSYIKMFEFYDYTREYNEFLTNNADISFPANCIRIPLECDFDLSFKYPKSPVVNDGYLFAAYSQFEPGTYNWPGTNSPTGHSFQQTQTYSLNGSFSEYYNTYDNKHILGAYSSTTTLNNRSRIIHSETKINGEDVDSWLKFLPDNELFLDDKYGKITSLIHFNGQLYFFQQKGFGILPILERQLMNPETPSQLVLGTGGVLERYDYISTTIGCEYRFGIVKSDNALYWRSDLNLGLYKYSGQLENISENKVKSLLHKPSSVITDEEVVTSYDQKYKEILFTNINKKDDTTYENQTYTKTMLAYNEKYGVFTDVRTKYDDLSIILNNNYYSCVGRRMFKNNSIVNNHMYIYNGGYLQVFNESGYDSKISLIFNESPIDTKVFDKLSFSSVEYSYKDKNPISAAGALTYMIQYEGASRNETGFSTIKVSNDYQKSASKTIMYNYPYNSVYPTNNIASATKRERTWELSIPRNETTSTGMTVPYFTPDNTNNTDSSRTFKERMRDKYIKVDLTKKNTTSMLRVPYLATTYRISKR